MDLSFIIVNWNTRELLPDCIGSISSTVRGLTFEIWVVDNGSTDGSAEAVRNRFPEVKIIENRENLGFAKASNQALRLMSGRFAVLLNSDARLTPGAVATIHRFMEENPQVGICGGQLLNEDGTRQNSIANIPNLATELLNKSILRMLFPLRYPGKERQHREPIEVESVIGACMVVRKEAIDDVGLMDESYFLFLEETDWCQAMRRRGWKVCHHPGARIVHLQGRSARKVNVRSRVEYWRSRYLFFRKNRGAVVFAVLLCGLVLKILTNLGAAFVLSTVTLFQNKRSVERLRLYGRLLMWHLSGLPEGYGLRGQWRENTS